GPPGIIQIKKTIHKGAPGRIAFLAGGDLLKGFINDFVEEKLLFVFVDEAGTGGDSSFEGRLGCNCVAEGVKSTDAENFPGKEKLFKLAVCCERFRGVIEQLGLRRVCGLRAFLCPIKTASYSFTHLGCRLVGEGERQDLPRVVYKSQEAKKPGDQQKGLTRTGRGSQVKAARWNKGPAAFFSIRENKHL